MVWRKEFSTFVIKIIFAFFVAGVVVNFGSNDA
jgi:hypothetical protein